MSSSPQPICLMKRGKLLLNLRRGHGIVAPKKGKGKDSSGCGDEEIGRARMEFRERTAGPGRL